MPPALRPPYAGIVAALCVVLWGSPLLAGQAAIPADGIEEVRHDMVVRLRNATIEVVVHRSFRPVGALDLPLSTSIHLPAAAAIVGFRLKTGSRWVPGLLLERGVAASRYDAQIVRGHPTSPLPVSERSYAPGKLQFARNGQARLTLPRLRLGIETEVEYRLVLPSCYRAGSHYLVLPTDSVHLQPTVRLAGGTTSLVRDLHAEPLPKSRATFPQSGCHVSGRGPTEAYRIPNPTPTRVTARWASQSASPDQRIGRLEFELPPVLRRPAKRPLVVFVFDASLSEGDEGLKRQIALAQLIASQYDHGTFQVVAFSRYARVLLPTFVAATELTPHLEGLSVASKALGNGSDLTAALREVAKVFDDTNATPPGSGGAVPRERRVIVLTDGAMAHRFSTDRAIAAFDSASAPVLLHVLYDTGGTSGPLWEPAKGQRRLDPIAEVTGGTSMSIYGGAAPTSHNRELLAHLVSPRRIDDFRIEAPVAFKRSPPYQHRLLLAGRSRAGGAGFGQTILWSPDAKRPYVEAPIRLTGRIWGKPWRLDVASPARFRRQFRALAVGDGTAQKLGKPDLLKWALRAHSMSPATMFFAPSDSLVPVAGWGRLGRSHYARAPRIRGDPVGVEHLKMTPAWHLRMRHYLQQGFRDHMRKCAAGKPWSDAAVALETTTVEVVEVDVFAQDAHVYRCADEWAWGLRLGAAFLFDTRFFIKAARDKG